MTPPLCYIASAMATHAQPRLRKLVSDFAAEFGGDPEWHPAKQLVAIALYVGTPPSERDILLDTDVSKRFRPQIAVTACRVLMDFLEAKRTSVTLDEPPENPGAFAEESKQRLLEMMGDMPSEEALAEFAAEAQESPESA